MIVLLQGLLRTPVARALATKASQLALAARAIQAACIGVPIGMPESQFFLFRYTY
jgi:hypothetical protein